VDADWFRTGPELVGQWMRRNYGTLCYEYDKPLAKLLLLSFVAKKPKITFGLITAHPAICITPAVS